MAKTKHSKMRVIWENMPEQCMQIWNEAGKIGKMKWRLPNKNTLKGIVADKDIKELYSITNSAIANKRMREILSPYLIEREKQRPSQKFIYDERAENLATWIVVEWGGIKNGYEIIPEWVNQLHDYSDEYTSKFIQKMTTRRISSWSKILAFADYENHAIYDARTSVALNVILSQIGSKHRFYMPATQNKDLPKTMEIVKRDMDRIWRGRKNVYRGYDDYIRLLNAIVHFTNAKSILDVEMVLFANGPKLAVEYAKKNGWEVEVDLENQEMSLI